MYIKNGHFPACLLTKPTSKQMDQNKWRGVKVIHWLHCKSNGPIGNPGKEFGRVEQISSESELVNARLTE
jgi:hypothetical protein